MNGAWSTERIGDVAGDVWTWLCDRGGEATVRAVEQGLESPQRLVDMAVGWLAREGKVELGRQGRAVRVRLLEG